MKSYTALAKKYNKLMERKSKLLDKQREISSKLYHLNTLILKEQKILGLNRLNYLNKILGEIKEEKRGVPISSLVKGTEFYTEGLEPEKIKEFVEREAKRHHECGTIQRKILLKNE